MASWQELLENGWQASQCGAEHGHKLRTRSPDYGRKYRHAHHRHPLGSPLRPLETNRLGLHLVQTLLQRPQPVAWRMGRCSPHTSQHLPFILFHPLPKKMRPSASTRLKTAPRYPSLTSFCRHRTGCSGGTITPLLRSEVRDTSPT